MESERIERIEKMISSFLRLPEEGQSYVLGISQVLLFAQDHFAEGKTDGERKRRKYNKKPKENPQSDEITL